MGPNPQEATDLVTITEELLNGKLHFLCSALLAAVSKLPAASSRQILVES